MIDLWPQCEPLAPHVLAVNRTYCRLSKVQLENPNEYVEMLCDCTWSVEPRHEENEYKANLVARYLWELNQYATALFHLEVAEKICADYADALGEDCLEYARTQVVRGCIYSSQNKYHLCGEVFNKALKIRERHLPENHELLANSYMQMGNYYTSEGRFEDAVHTHSSVLRIRSINKPQVPKQILISHFNLARAQLAMGDLHGTEETLKQAEHFEAQVHDPNEKLLNIAA
jgi:tetratricopeptide (TPR) repeat protein